MIRAPTPRCSRASPVSSVRPPPRHRTKASTSSVAVGTHVITTSDPDDEVRAVVRGVVDAMRAGTPLERMAILYASPDPYARLLHEHLDRAGIAHNGATGARARRVRARGRAPPTARLAGRGFPSRRALHAPRVGSVPRRRRASRARVGLGTCVAGGPHRGWARPVAHAPRRVRRTTVGRRNRRRVERANANASPGCAPSWTTSPPTSTSPRVPVSWSGKATWAHGLVGRFLGDESPTRAVAGVRAGGGAAGRGCARPARRARRGRGGADAGGLPSDARARARRRARERVGRLGEGMLVGPVGFALGVDLDRLFVCGLAEGVFPARPGDDPLAERRRARRPGWRARRCAPTASKRTTVRCSRRSRRPPGSACCASRAATCGGAPSTCRRDSFSIPRTRSAGFASSTRERRGARRSRRYIDGVARVEFPSTAPRVRRAFGARATGALDATVYRRGRALLDARRSDGFTRFDGNLADLGARVAARGPTAPGRRRLTDPTRDSGSAARTRTSCSTCCTSIRSNSPRKSSKLRPIDRGSIVHEILDQFVGEGGRLADRRASARHRRRGVRAPRCQRSLGSPAALGARAADHP